MPQNYRNSVVPPLRLAFLMWIIFSFEFFLNLDFGFLGVHPRHLAGLIGIFTSPLIHGNFQHIVSNTIPLILLGTTLFVFYNAIAVRVFLQCYIFTGILVWVFGREFWHIGASGVIYGLAFFLISYGFFRKDFRSLLISIIVVSIYGGLVYGVLPTRANISWESHLFGGLVGIATAYTLRHTRQLD